MRKLNINIILLLIICMTVVSMLFAGCPSYKLSTEVVPPGSGTISPSSGTFSAMSNVNLIANPAQYYIFVGWAGDASGSTNPLKIIMNSNKHIVAHFEKIKIPIQTNSNPSGGGTVRPETGMYEAGSKINITATQANGYRFVQWEGDASGSTNPLPIVVDNKKVITAKFIKQYALKVRSEPTNAGDISPGAGLYDEGKKITLNAVPSFPYYPKNWIGANDNNVFPTVVTMDKDTLVTVIFAQCTKRETQTKFGPVYNKSDGTIGPVASVPIQLNQFEWVQGEIIWHTPNTPNTPIKACIKDPSGNILKDFGASRQTNFNFFAPTTGSYKVVFENNSIWYAAYTLTYTVWVKQP